MKEISIEIGGQLIDRHYDDWLEIWAQLTVPADKKLGYLMMIGQDPVDGVNETGLQALVTTATVDGVANTRITKTGRKLFVPLQFWFCRNVGLALPLIALQYHEVKVNVTFNESSVVRSFVITDGTVGPLTDVTLWVDYIYLDTDERRRFAQVSHEYLIEQLQVNSDTYTQGSKTSVNLTFNHPVKELVWVCKDRLAEGILYDTGRYIVGQDILTSLDNFANGNTAGNRVIRTAQLQLNGQDRFAERNSEYFNRMQPFHHHTCVPESPGINVYSFALKPEEHQPSGTCNFSRIDNAKLILNIFSTAANATIGGTVHVFAVNYNVLRVMSGMGGLAYSN